VLRGSQASFRTIDNYESITYSLGPNSEIPSLRLIPVIDNEFVLNNDEVPKYKLMDYQRGLQSQFMLSLAQPAELYSEFDEPIEMEVRSKRFEHAKRKRARRRHGKKIILQ
jgi:hypothetical protein